MVDKAGGFSGISSMGLKRAAQGGVWNVNRPGRPNPFGVQWRETVWDAAASGGLGGEVEKMKTEFYDTEEKRDARAAVLRKQRKKGAMQTVTRGELDEWHAFKSAVNGAPWQDVVAGWRAWMMQAGLKECEITVDTAVTDALAQAKTLSELDPPKLSGDTYRQKKHKLTLFAEQFGDLRLNVVPPLEVQSWILDFDEVQSDATFDNYLKHAKALFTPYVEQGVLQKNPLATIKKRADAEAGHFDVLTVAETAYVFLFALERPRYLDAIGRLALEAFLGLRFSSGCRIEKKDINFDDRGILLPKHKLKTGMVKGGRRHYIDGVIPAQVWEWLKITPDACWNLTPRQYMRLKSELFVEARVRHPHNCFRHGFCTYDVTARKNPGITAYLLCHQDQDLLWQRYKGVEAGGRIITEADGKLYQTITPATVRKLAKGYTPPAVPALPAA